MSRPDARESASPVLEARRLHLSFGPNEVLTECDLAVHAGDRIALMGPSGSGKSTLLHCLGGILRPDAGEVLFDGRRVDDQPDAVRSRCRLERMGVVFQFGDLVPELTLEENVMLPLLLMGVRRRTARAAARQVLGELDIAALGEHRASTVSGGEVQRAAIARALVHEPVVVLADEPTGSLDTVNAEVVLDLLVRQTAERGTALVVVTHDHLVASQLDRLALISDGRVSEREAVHP